MNDKLFNESLIKKLIEYLSTYDKKCLSYCLVRKADGESDFLMMKTMKNKNDFKEEVNNLSRYFNAKIIKGE